MHSLRPRLFGGFQRRIQAFMQHGFQQGGGYRPAGTVPDTCFFIEVYGFEAISSRMFGFRQMVYRLINSQC
jgi:hypothetical protein